MEKSLLSCLVFFFKLRILLKSNHSMCPLDSLLCKLKKYTLGKGEGLQKSYYKMCNLFSNQPSFWICILIVFAGLLVKTDRQEPWSVAVYYQEDCQWYQAWLVLTPCDKERYKRYQFCKKQKSHSLRSTLVIVNSEGMPILCSKYSHIMSVYLAQRLTSQSYSSKQIRYR